MTVRLYPEYGREYKHVLGSLFISFVPTDVLILLANFLEKYVGKSKKQNAGKIGGKWAPRNDNLA